MCQDRNKIRARSCKCGCGQKIEIKPYHQSNGVPEYINWHYLKTDEYKKEIKQRWADPQSAYNSKEFRERIRECAKNRINTTEFIEKCRLAKMGEKNPNFGKIPAHLKDIHKNWREKDYEGYRRHQCEAAKKAFLSCPRISILELKFQRVLNEMGIDFIPQFDFTIGFVDILIKPDIALFIDGDFWHGNPIRFKSLTSKQVAQRTKDERQNIYLKNIGYNVVRLWEYDIKHLDDIQIKKLILKIQKEGYYFIPETLGST